MSAISVGEIDKNSNLNSAGDVVLDALLKNILDVEISDSDDSPLTFTLRTNDAYNMMMLKSSSQAETKIVIDNSEINTTNLNARALAYNGVSNSLSSTIKTGENDTATDTQGGSGATLVGVINSTDIETSIEVKNNSKIKTTKDVNNKLQDASDEKIAISSKVIDVDNNKVKLEFIDISDEIANKLIFNYMKKAIAK